MGRLLDVRMEPGRITSLDYYPSYAYQLVYNGGSYAWMEGASMNTMWSYKYGGIINQGTESAQTGSLRLLARMGFNKPSLDGHPMQ